MIYDYRPLHADFGVEVVGADVTQPLGDEAFAEIREAFETHSILLFRGPVIEDARQIEFSDRFGNVQMSFSANQTGGSKFSRQSNIDAETDDVFPADHARLTYLRGNQLWHSDSSYREKGSLCSVLSAREVPPEGGNTDFVSTRTAYDKLPADMQAELDGLVTVHSIEYSRSLTAPDILTEAQKSEAPPARHSLVQTNPANGRKSLLMGAHAWHIEGRPVEDGIALLADLLARATPEDAIYPHVWRQGDVLVWDNRAVLHRATHYDMARYRRRLERTTITTRDAA